MILLYRVDVDLSVQVNGPTNQVNCEQIVPKIIKYKVVTTYLLSKLVPFFWESIWGSALLSGFSVEVFSESEAHEETCDEASVVAKIVNVAVSHWAYIQVYWADQESENEQVHSLSRSLSSHEAPIREKVRNIESYEAEHGGWSSYGEGLWFHYRWEKHATKPASKVKNNEPF